MFSNHVYEFYLCVVNVHLFRFGDTFQTLALQLLYEHAALIDPSAALLMLPDQLSATLVWPYLQRIIPITLHEGRLARITAGLEKMTNLEVCFYMFIYAAT